MNTVSLSKPFKPELLAPAGNLESFFAALEAGADAVYLGLKKFSARKLARNFTLEELARVVKHAHDQDIKIYVAINSLIFPSEIPELVETLGYLKRIGPDALIVQDPSLFYLVARYFPEIRIHASTLTTIHNHMGAQLLENLGVKRIVLARELSIEEIREIRENVSIELEVFVHGALCYSYSGLCLASSFLGGKSGLRGSCVQPCRRLFRSKAEVGYFLSANDLSALEVIPRLKEIGVDAFKLEGRMKPAEYVYNVVRAYRLVVDSAPDQSKEAIARGLEILKETPGRKPTTGYFTQGKKRVKSLEILAPHRSGTSGLWVGSVLNRKGRRITVKVRKSLQLGDRLRPESKAGKEKQAFVVREMEKAGRKIICASPGDTVTLKTGIDTEQGDKLFKVGSKTLNRWSSQAKLKKKLTPVDKKLFEPDEDIANYRDEILMDLRDEEHRWTRLSERSYLKIGRLPLLSESFKSPVDYVILVATRENLEKLARRRFSRDQLARFGWSLPPVILEKDIDYYLRAISWYIEQGFTRWWINNWSHFKFFEDTEVELVADSSLNVSNNVELWTYKSLGCRAAVLSWEMSRSEISKLVKSRPPLPVYFIVYGYPQIFISRVIPPVKGSRISLEGDKRSTFNVINREGICVITPTWPVNLFDTLEEIKSIGIKNFVIDCSHSFCDKKELVRVVSGYRRERTDLPRTRFNYDRQIA